MFKFFLSSIATTLPRLILVKRQQIKWSEFKSAVGHYKNQISVIILDDQNKIKIVNGLNKCNE